MVQAGTLNISLMAITSGSLGMEVHITKISSHALMYTWAALSWSYHQISLCSEVLITHPYNVISVREFCSSPPIFLVPKSFPRQAPTYSFSCPCSESFRSNMTAHHSISIIFWTLYYPNRTTVSSHQAHNLSCTLAWKWAFPPFGYLIHNMCNYYLIHPCAGFRD